MASLCHSMDGCGLIELYSACVSSSESMYKMLNTQFVEINRRTLPIAAYFKFIGKLKQYLRKKPNEKTCIMVGKLLKIIPKYNHSVPFVDKLELKQYRDINLQ
ncbi:unnamed protein product, partial [Didymodactylos carnosus]